MTPYRRLLGIFLRNGYRNGAHPPMDRLVTNRRTATLVLSVLIGAVAALFAYMYVGSAQNRAFKGAELVPAFVAAEAIPKGMAADEVLSKDFVKADKVPEKYRPAGALADKEAIRGKVALGNISAGQIVVDGMFVDPVVAQETAAKRIPAGQVAVTVQVDEVRGVAGLITPGDKVNIMAPSPEGWRTLFENVDVLYIGQVPAAQAGEPAATTAGAPAEARNLVTFAVPQFAAQKIVFASKTTEGIVLTLVPPGNPAKAVPPVGANNLFTGGVTPYEG